MSYDKFCVINIDLQSQLITFLSACNNCTKVCYYSIRKVNNINYAFVDTTGLQPTPVKYLNRFVTVVRDLSHRIVFPRNNNQPRFEITCDAAIFAVKIQ